MKCHAGIEFASGSTCPKCNAKLGEVCWPGINRDLADLPLLRQENDHLRAVLTKFVSVCDTAVPTSLLAELALICAVARAALRQSSGRKHGE
jgi:hypothetical protein